MPNLGLEIKRRCGICGKVFIIKTLDSLYCCKKCSDVAYIKGKVDARIAEWKAERLAATGKEPIVRSTQHLSVSLVIGGNNERMNELAFGNQVLQERGNNAHIKRMPGIEQFALDNYKALAERIGEKNIISFIAHCDEKNCHIHATITPILEDGRLSAKDMFGGVSLVAARDKMREWHDWYAAVNEKWGLERGDDIHETGARHKSLEEHNRELHRENKSLEEELETKRRAVKGLTTMIENLTRRQEEIQSQIAELEAQQQESDSNKEDILRQIKFLNQTLTEIRINLREKRFFCNLVEDFVNISDRIVINTQDPQIIDSGKSIK